MKHLVFRWRDGNYKKAVKEAQKSRYKSRLIQVFTSIEDPKKIRKLLDSLAVDFPDTLVVGATTAGEIARGEIYENETIISLSLFKRTKLKAAVTKRIDIESGRKLADTVCTKKTKAIIVLGEGLHGEDYEGFLLGLKEERPEIIVAGGITGDNLKLKKTFLFLGKKIYKKGVVVVSFSGKKLYAKSDYNLGWSPIGREFEATKVKGNILRSIDNQKAIEVFKKYLGKETIENNIPEAFQLLYKEDKRMIARAPVGIKDDGILLAAPIKKGQRFQFGFSNTSNLLLGADSIGKSLFGNPAEAIYIFSCIVRKALFGKILESEFGVFESVAPTAGFFTYGEFYGAGKNNAVLNCTTTILVLSESKKRNKKAKYRSMKRNSFESVTFTALAHFIKQTSVELLENTRLLEEYRLGVDHFALVSKTDIKGIITYVNDNFSKVSKYSKEELLGKNHNIVRDPNVPKSLFKKMWRTILSGKVWHGVISNRAKDGSIYYVDTTIVPIFDQKHTTIQEFIAIRQDITKQIKAKKRIEEKEKLIKAILDNQDSIVIYTSKEKGMLSVNQKLFEVFDFKSFEDFKSRYHCICDLFLEEEGYIYPKKYPDWLDDLAQKRFERPKVKLKLKDGKIHTFTIMVKQIGEEYIINLYDITDLEQAILKANASEHAKSVFLANMSHEIRTPLNGILGFTDVLTRRKLDSETKKYIDIIHKSGQTLLNIVNDILDFSKIESGELILSPIEANLLEEMEVVVATFSSVVRTKHIYYYTYIDPSLPKSLLCDAQRIKQVMSNLIGNAVKFTPKEGSIWVTIKLKEIKEKKARIHFSVKDSGIGIPKEKLKTIFTPFSQADDSISRKFGGTGLGLAISNQYINMMGSQIEVRSKEGEGSEFFFELTLDVVDERFSIAKNENDVEICVLRTQNGIGCAINEIVFSYLERWGFHYKQIDSLDELSATSDILIVCAQLFDLDSCKEALEKYEKLQLVYIEGVEEHFDCVHPKFHLIEQPMTGSALFDKIISLTHGIDVVLQEDESPTENKKFNGRVLVAEDNETNQMLISVMLDERGVSYTIVGNGKEAIEAASKKEYDIIFMDINMPVLDGISATKELRKKGYKKPIVSLSANVIESDKKSFLEAGVDDTLNKPLIPEELDAILKRYLGSDKESDAVEVDTVSADTIAKSLRLPEATVKTLLGSFAKSLRSNMERVEKEGLDKDILHTLKGLVGNMRLEKSYELIKRYEEEIEGWNDTQKEQNKEQLIKLLQQILQQITD